MGQSFTYTEGESSGLTPALTPLHFAPLPPVPPNICLLPCSIACYGACVPPSPTAWSPCHCSLYSTKHHFPSIMALDTALAQGSKQVLAPGPVWPRGSSWGSSSSGPRTRLGSGLGPELPLPQPLLLGWAEAGALTVGKQQGWDGGAEAAGETGVEVKQGVGLHGAGQQV